MLGGDTRPTARAMARNLWSSMQAATPSPTRTREPQAETMCTPELLTYMHTTLISTPKYAPCYVTTLVNNNVNSTELRGDCDIPDCFLLLSQNKASAADSPGLNCYLYDMVTKQAFPNGDLVNFCFPQTTKVTLAPPSTTPPAPSTAVVSGSSSPSSSSSSVVGGAIGGVVGLALLLGIVWCWCRRSRRSKHDDYPRDQSAFNQLLSPFEAVQVAKHLTNQQGDSGSQNPTANGSSNASSNHIFHAGSFERTPLHHGVLTDLEQLELHRIPYADVHLVQSVAEGAFGQVWLGSFMGQQVAVKKLLPRKATAEDLAQFIKEILLVSKLESPYVVSFVGAAWHKPVDMVLVTEFMDRGDLRGVLQANAAKDPADKTFTWRDKVECALSIAEGLVYLHSMDPVVIHRDLKSRNVLVDSTRGCKITDFGIARETYDQTLTLNAGTYRWMAPEVVQDGYYSQSADLFSFGVILSELDTEQLPYANQRNDRGNPFTDLRLMDAVAKGRILPAFTAACPAWFQELGVQCMALDPAQRPSAIQVSFVIRRHLQSLPSAPGDSDDSCSTGYLV